MEIIKTPIQDLLIVKPRIFTDARGFFCETYHEMRYQQAGITARLVQDNQSQSTYGVVRGLHFQREPYAQAKLLSVSVGMVWDVAVDLRKDSPTFGQWFGVELSAENHLQFFIPRGFAHGFSVLSPTVLFTYKCDNFYTPEAESGLFYADPNLHIDWKVPADKIIVSEKDNVLPLLRDWQRF
ncbi:MAG: dTDP-4-dehydrorhamnose 3,5-epimerase [Prevotellaceae bacterium]|jgi:dTDP-4-dehydrorhamnose 3,5-epimerase|nr:dTDP-4-dehydrorhamnose 3,5-epimerase [Prevotellaceae bacterium]